MDKDAEPRFYKARTVPFAVKDKVIEQLTKLEEQGVIKPVAQSDWAAPIVPVLKSSGEVRICGDFKVTVNKASKIDSFPLPHIDELFTKLTGGQNFPKLDLSSAYLQLPLEEESQKYTTINTPKGLYVYTRMPFGINSALGIFQRILDRYILTKHGCISRLYISDRPYT